MNAEAWLTLLGRDTLCLSAGILAAQLLRPLLRRWGGATVLPWRWVLPLLLVMAGHAPQGLLPAATLTLPPQVIQAWGRDAGAHPMSVPIAQAWVSLWLTGVLLVAAAQWRSHRRFVRQLSRGEEGWRAPPGFNPALLGLWRPRLVLPVDFEQRFEPAERVLIVAHENAHRQRRDNWTNLLALCVCLLHWFNPLLWWALARLRQDQELACDATVLRQPDLDWRPYAQALLKVQGQGAPGSPLVAAWRSTHPLIERIEMIKLSPSTRASARAAWAARGVLLALGLGGASLVMAFRAEPAEVHKQSSSAEPALRAGEVCSSLVKPELPAPSEHEAPKGTSQLHATFTVAPDGKISEIKIDGPAFFQPSIREAISHYGCAATGRTRHAVQEFMFRLE